MIVKEVWYKYVVEMAPVKRNVHHLINSIREKCGEFQKKKLEFHLSPFYILTNGKLAYQPVFDIDTLGGVDKLLEFLVTHDPHNWFVEITSEHGIHICSHTTYHPIEGKDDIVKLRGFVREKLGKVLGIDVPTSVRPLPVRRAPSCDFRHHFVIRPLPLEKFKVGEIKSYIKRWSREVPSCDELTHILLHYTLPTRTKPISKLYKLLDHITNEG